jgi:tetratricopeptide (TPR) repeat protein
MKSPLLLVTVCLSVSASAAEPLRGAAAILDELAAKANAKDVQPAAVSPVVKFRANLANFTARAATLAPAAAAQEWLALGDRLAKLYSQRQIADDEFSNPPQFSDMLAALPPPAAWDELAKAVAARPVPAALKDVREFGLRMLAAALTGDRAALATQVAALEKLLLKENTNVARQMAGVTRGFNDYLLALSDDPKAILAALERQIADAERNGGNGYRNITLPDLAGIVGEASATPLIERAILTKSRGLSIRGRATAALAARLALKLADKLQVPRWELVNSPDALELYEALEKKFARATPAQKTLEDKLAEMQNAGYEDSRSKNSARTFYLLGLITHGRAADAAKLARSMKDGSGEFELNLSHGNVALLRAGFITELDDFFHELLTQDPGVPFWDAYFETAARSGRTERMLALARASIAKPDPAGGVRGGIREKFYRALLAADQVDEAVKELRALIASAPKTADRNAATFRGRTAGVRQHGLALATLGRLLDHPEWTDEGLAAAMPKPGATDASDNIYEIRSLADLLGKLGRPADAEKLLADQLAQSIAPPARRDAYYGGDRAEAELLAALVNLYHDAGRHDDVLLLLEKSPHWGAKDLVQLASSEMSALGSEEGRAVLRAAAAALIHAGRKAEARAVTDMLLDLDGGNDRNYELLIQLAGPDALPKLDALFVRDRFEERPLIWKALLLHQAGKDEEAEKIARQAVAIDPSDGEEDKGDRMRVYAVLAEIRAARGDAKEADILRGVVQAIRLSENADDFASAGLLSRAVKMYEDSLNHFADAYCIQSRLAVRLSELGRHEEAAKHYAKAFELMPDSFGRVESHCFGCEGAFRGEQAQNAAERVFTALVVKTPDKPQVHYLLGYLREQQGREKDALPHYRQALKLDPDYLNAWKHLGELSREMRLPVAERDDIALNILRLDPLGRHGSPDLTSAGDLRRLWLALDTAAKFRTKLPATLLPLTASGAEIEKQEREMKNSRNRFDDFRIRIAGRSGDGITPASVFQQHTLLNAIGNLISISSQFGSEE